MRRANELYCEKTSWQGRRAYALENGLVRLVTLMGGGHIAELRFSDSSRLPTLNPLWIPPWKTIEPYAYNPKAQASRYGALPEGKLLSGLVGHNLCLDYFGPPSPEEVRQGLSQHGEAPSSRWRKSGLSVTARDVRLTVSVKLPVAGLRFRRQMRLRKSESVVYFTETVINERRCDHFFHWTQHVTLGPPFLSSRDSTVSTPATKGVTFPHGYGAGKALLVSGEEFRWPMAPLDGGGTIDLTHALLRRGSGFVVGLLLDLRRDAGFVAALNARARLLIGYCFRRQDFPWVAVWEENRARATVPWSRKTQTRGLEFGTTPLPVSRRENFSSGTLFGRPTLTCVPARGRKTIRYAAFLAHLPSDFRNVRDVKLAGDKILIQGSGHELVTIPAAGLAAAGLV
jgi:hypothetical protein